MIKLTSWQFWHTNKVTVILVQHQVPLPREQHNIKNSNKLFAMPREQFEKKIVYNIQLNKRVFTKTCGQVGCGFPYFYRRRLLLCWNALTFP
jgi:hypothetical protein